MTIITHVPLKKLTSFAVQAIAPSLVNIAKHEDLRLLTPYIDQAFYVLGAGTNTLFVDQQTPVIIKMALQGVQIERQADGFLLTIAAGECWHDIVTSTVNQGMPGLENLALIPGTVGAAPIQNIGAYGAEFADFCVAVQWYDFATQTIRWLDNAACQFGYRNSIFKSILHNRGLILAVKIKLPSQWHANLHYAGLDKLPLDIDAVSLMHHVIAIRQQKLPDYHQLPNAGSFFKNPIVTMDSLQLLQKRFVNLPYYPQAAGQVKLAAGWLIEQAGLKGYRLGEVGIHDKQALVLVNYGTEQGQDIIQLVHYVRIKVFELFNIVLEPEVRLVNQLGEFYMGSELSHDKQ